jgi:hypothetical protein
MTASRLPLAELEHLLAVAAYVVLRHGDAYTPLMDRLDAEVAQARKKATDRDRAERILKSLSLEVSHVALPA